MANCQPKRKSCRLHTESSPPNPNLPEGKLKKRDRTQEKCSPPKPPTLPRQEQLGDAGNLDNGDIKDDKDEIAGDLQHRRTLERNRIAAKKCRIRKHDEASALASRERTLEGQNRNLRTYYNSLSSEIYLLKTELFRHTHCNCTLIQEYIANEARRSVVKLSAPSSTIRSWSPKTSTGQDDPIKCTSRLDAKAPISNDHKTVDISMAEPITDRWVNKLQMPDNTAIIPNLTYLHDSLNMDMSNYRSENIQDHVYDQLGYHMVHTHQWPFSGAGFGQALDTTTDFGSSISTTSQQ